MRVSGFSRKSSLKRLGLKNIFITLLWPELSFLHLFYNLAALLNKYDKKNTCCDMFILWVIQEKKNNSFETCPAPVMHRWMEFIQLSLRDANTKNTGGFYPDLTLHSGWISCQVLSFCPTQHIAVGLTEWPFTKLFLSNPTCDTWRVLRLVLRHNTTENSEELLWWKGAIIDLFVVCFRRTLNKQEVSPCVKTPFGVIDDCPIVTCLALCSDKLWVVILC